MDSGLVRLSRRLAYVLRHDPASVGLALDAQGWVAVDDLLAALAAHGASVSYAELDAVVAGNDKRRFAVRAGAGGRAEIRASQGHSVPVDLGLEQMPPPPVLYHGTSATALPSIRARGLRRGERHHVHLSPDLPTALAVGRRRRGAVAVLEVDAAAMAAAGYAFYRSANGVWLTDHVPPEYLRGPP
ncbi:RNA 2'-phosphotransferase [Phytohabitans kaempferiae]|uniref:Probable RNA 2'-phosphotransferase n=1 Tax=Phytohabitans kaempferiae TaxID=1620943 RepID=A0ABV6MC31_9ACTN